MSTPKRVALLFCNSWLGWITLAVTTALAVAVMVPTVVSTAAANSRTADPVPKHHVLWNGDLRHFVETARASLDETWGILAAYSQSKTVPSAMLPNFFVTENAQVTGCRVDQATFAIFDPSDSLVATCYVERRIYLSAPLAAVYSRKVGLGGLLAYLSVELLGTKAAGRDMGFAICVVGAWLGYLGHWGNIDPVLDAQAQSSFAEKLKVFRAGYDKRSLGPCLAM